MIETPKFWWVNQGGSYEETRRTGYIWASFREGAQAIWHWDNVGHIKEGDVLFHYVQGTGVRAVSQALSNGHRADSAEESLVDPGVPSWVAKVKYLAKLSKPVPKDRVAMAIRDLVIEKGPI